MKKRKEKKMCHWFYHLLVGILFIALPNGVNANFRYNVSLEQMATCHQYIIPNNRGYNYLDFFHIRNLNNNKLKDTELLHLKFYVMTARDAHVLLSVTDRPTLSDRVYEIGKFRIKFNVKKKKQIFLIISYHISFFVFCFF